MNGQIYKKELERIFGIARNRCKNITDDMLDSDGAIYYMNRKDGTDFDWKVNRRLCEFFIFHKNEVGFIKCCIMDDNKAYVYIFEDAGRMPTDIFKEELENIEALKFSNLMYAIADKKGKDDQMINDLDWDVDDSECDFFEE